jgi:putative endonuclease
MTNTDKDWSVYIVKCSDDSYYCGIAKDVYGRINQHNEGKGAKYTRSRLPVELVVCKDKMTKSQALSLEHKIKQQKRDKKIEYLLNADV